MNRRQRHFRSGSTFFVETHVTAASVELEHVDAPPGEGVGVVPHVTSTAGEASARLTADVLVDAQLQTAVVHLENTWKGTVYDRIGLVLVVPFVAAARFCKKL